MYILDGSISYRIHSQVHNNSLAPEKKVDELCYREKWIASEVVWIFFISAVIQKKEEEKKKELRIRIETSQ